MTTYVKTIYLNMKKEIELLVLPILIYDNFNILTVYNHFLALFRGRNQRSNLETCYIIDSSNDNSSVECIKQKEIYRRIINRETRVLSILVPGQKSIECGIRMILHIFIVLVHHYSRTSVQSINFGPYKKTLFTDGSSRIVLA